MIFLEYCFFDCLWGSHYLANSRLVPRNLYPSIQLKKIKELSNFKDFSSSKWAITSFVEELTFYHGRVS